MGEAPPPASGARRRKSGGIALSVCLFRLDANHLLAPPFNFRNQPAGVSRRPSAARPSPKKTTSPLGRFNELARLVSRLGMFAVKIR
jgi:hypothetical protein